jgi:glycosyltransferase involved in cell wall biosynthesis
MKDELITICIATYKRPGLLRMCLSAIANLERPDNYCLEIVVVDNDKDESASLLCNELKNKINFPLHYLVQTERGLSSVRNSLLEKSIELEARLIAFIDDDEQPAAGWLLQIVQAMNKYDADVCTGPVIELGTEYLSAHKKALTTGSKSRHVSTNNVLFKTALVTTQGLRFDPFYNFIGGEDFDFFERSAKLGNKHIWVAEALIFEVIPEQRKKLSYLFYRHFTGGINSILRYKRSNPAWHAWLRFSPKIAGKLIGAILTLLLGLVKLNKEYFYSSIKKLASGIGYFAGLLNIVVERYRNIETEELNNSAKSG